jgi:hypothetical protein
LNFEKARNKNFDLLMINGINLAAVTMNGVQTQTSVEFFVPRVRKIKSNGIYDVNT